MGVLDYDRTRWEEHIVLILESCIYSANLVFVLAQCIQYLRLDLIHCSRRPIFVFIIFVLGAYICRIGYFYSGTLLIPFPPYIYGIFAYFTSLFLVTAYICFLAYVIESINLHMEAHTNKLVHNYKAVIAVILSVYWPVMLSLYAGMIYQHYVSTSWNWKVGFRIAQICVFLMVLCLQIYLVSLYQQLLQTYPFTYREKKPMLRCLFIVITLQVIFNITNAGLSISGLYYSLENYSNSTGIPLAQLVYMLYHILTEILLTFVYAQYFRKDRSYLQLMQTSNPIDAPLSTYPLALDETYFFALLQSFVIISTLFSHLLLLCSASVDPQIHVCNTKKCCPCSQALFVFPVGCDRTTRVSSALASIISSTQSCNRLILHTCLSSKAYLVIIYPLPKLHQFEKSNKLLATCISALH